MKTMEELYQEVLVSPELKQKFLEAFQGKESLEALLKEQGCEVTAEEMGAFLKEKADAAREASDEELAAIAGGSKEGAKKAWELIDAFFSGAFAC